MRKNLLVQSLEDFMSPKVLFISLISFLITIAIIVFSLTLIFENIGGIQDIFPEATKWVNGLIGDLEQYSLLAFILEHKIMMTIFHYLMYFGLGILAYYIFFAVYSIVISFFATIIIKHIQKEHYHNVQLKGLGLFSTGFFYIKTIIITAILFILLSPAYFIPALNILIFLPIYYFFHKTLVFDISSVINNLNEYKRVKRANWGELKGYTVLCFLITLIPIIGILAYPYYIIYVGHYLFKETVELRHTDAFRSI